MKIHPLLFVALILALHGEPRVPVLQPVESVPKEIGGLEFSVVTQAEWRPLVIPQGDDLVVQLRITNRGEKPLCFPTLDSFSVILTDSEGKATRLAGARDGTIITPVIVLDPGKGFSYPLLAKLRYSGGSQAMELEFKDRTGGESRTPIKPGEHSLAVELCPSPQDFVKNGTFPAPLWSAKGVTEPVAFKVALPEP